MVTSQQDLGARLLRQLKGVGVIPSGTRNVKLASIELVAAMVEVRGRKDVADQLRNAELHRFLAGERQDELQYATLISCSAVHSSANMLFTASCHCEKVRMSQAP